MVRQSQNAGSGPDRASESVRKMRSADKASHPQPASRSILRAAGEITADSPAGCARRVTAKAANHGGKSAAAVSASTPGRLSVFCRSAIRGHCSTAAAHAPAVKKNGFNAVLRAVAAPNQAKSQRLSTYSRLPSAAQASSSAGSLSCCPRIRGTTRYPQRRSGSAVMSPHSFSNCATGYTSS